MSYKIVVEDDRGRSHVVVEDVRDSNDVPGSVRMTIQIAIANAAYWLPPGRPTSVITTERKS